MKSGQSTGDWSGRRMGKLAIDTGCNVMYCTALDYLMYCKALDYLMYCKALDYLMYCTALDYLK
jgi:hypothetical protein